MLSPAAYFADLLMFLKDRKAADPGIDKVKDILFRRRPDLGFLELNCDNALTPCRTLTWSARCWKTWSMQRVKTTWN